MRTVMLTTVTAAIVCFCNVTRADEEKVALDKLPKEVKESVKKRFPKADLVEASKETEDGKTTYEVSIKDGGKKIDVTLATDGKLLMIEKEIASKDLPKAVKDVIEKKYAKSTIKLAEEVIKVTDGKEKLEYYETI